MSKHILVVDDEKEVTKALNLRLTKLGYKITCVSTGQEALKVFLEVYYSQPFDVILLDVDLPDEIRVEGIRQGRPVEIHPPQEPQVGHQVGILRPRRRRAVGRTERRDLGPVLGRVLAGEQGQVAGPLRRSHLREGAGVDLVDQGPAQGMVAQAARRRLRCSGHRPLFPRDIRSLRQDVCLEACRATAIRDIRVNLGHPGPY